MAVLAGCEKNWKSGNRVLKLGAGTGQYSHTLARQGCAVNAVELTERNIEIFQRNTLDLSAFPDNQYDMIPGAKGLKSDAGLPARGFLNLGPAKNMKKQPDQGGF